MLHGGTGSPGPAPKQLQQSFTSVHLLSSVHCGIPPLLPPEPLDEALALDPLDALALDEDALAPPVPPVPVVLVGSEPPEPPVPVVLPPVPVFEPPLPHAVIATIADRLPIKPAQARMSLPPMRPSVSRPGPPAHGCEDSGEGRRGGA
jgi:hypothetical protein